MSLEYSGRFLVATETAGHAEALPPLAGSALLFKTVPSEAAAPPKAHWRLYEPKSVAAEHPWDAAHAIVAEHAEAAVNSYVEPDLRHERSLLPHAGPAGASPEAIAPTDGWRQTQGLSGDYPPYPDTAFLPAWHLERARFPQAWTLSRGAGVRIAHLDTGYYPDHRSTPVGMQPGAGRNFFEGSPTDLKDPGTGLNAGHGTATLALLAGKDVDLQYVRPDGTLGGRYRGTLGGAPDATIIPVRIGGIGGSVVHLYSSSMAQGLQWALKAGDEQPCDVVSVSHGGLPTKAWVAAVNDLYDAGIVVVAAAGDSFYAGIIDVATHFTVYPSACYRVVTATGETYDHGPYTTEHFGVMQGSWGPAKVMKKALGASTPNVPWMRLGSPTAWDMNGGGTSASTPQIAAACALWLSKYGAGLPRDWRRVAAVRHALFETVADRELNLPKIGVGALDAAAMLDDTLANSIIALAIQPDGGGKLPHIAPDTLRFPLLQLLFGLAPPGPGVDEMYHVEALQIVHRSANPRLARAMEDYPDGTQLPRRLQKSLQDDFLHEPDLSATLRAYLAGRAAVAGAG